MTKIPKPGRDFKRNLARLTFGAPALDDARFLDTRTEMDRYYGARSAGVTWGATANISDLEGLIQGLQEAHRARCR